MKNSAKLTEDRVRQIRRDLAEGKPAREISALLGLNVETIRRVGRRESWAWVTEEKMITPDAQSSLAMLELAKKQMGLMKPISPVEPERELTEVEKRVKEQADYFKGDRA